jgi:hypothetical protein
MTIEHTIEHTIATTTAEVRVRPVARERKDLMSSLLTDVECR